MTPSDLITALLVAGLQHFGSAEDDRREIKVGKVGEVDEEHFHKHPDYRSIWRYPDVKPFDIGAVILHDERVLVLYEGETPNHGKWEHHRIVTDPAEAWDFIRNFLQEHP